MKIWKSLMAAAVLVLALARPAATAIGDPPPEKTGTLGISVTISPGLGCAEFMCGTNHNQVLI